MHGQLFVVKETTKGCHVHGTMKTEVLEMTLVKFL